MPPIPEGQSLLNDIRNSRTSSPIIDFLLIDQFVGLLRDSETVAIRGGYKRDQRTRVGRFRGKWTISDRAVCGPNGSRIPNRLINGFL